MTNYIMIHYGSNAFLDFNAGTMNTMVAKLQKISIKEDEESLETLIMECSVCMMYSMLSKKVNQGKTKENMNFVGDCMVIPFKTRKITIE